MDTHEKPDVLLVGHSFIRRLRDHLSPHEHGKRGRDISESRPHLAKAAAHSANIADCVRGVYTSSQRINLISDLWKSESTAISIRPSFVLLHVGSNDLAQMTHVNKTSAENSAMLVVDFANSLVNDLGVNRVIFNSVVPRDSSNMRCTADVFSTNMHHFNSVLLKEADKHKHLIYNHLHGFYKVKVDNKDLPLAISTWSHDGIHCNETAMTKYVQRTRFGIISALATTHKWSAPTSLIWHTTFFFAVIFV